MTDSDRPSHPARSKGHRQATFVAARIGLATVVFGAIVACNLGPGQPAITCADVPTLECQRQADQIIADAQRDTPFKRIVSIVVSRHDGVHVRFDDGTGWSAIP